MTKPKAKKQSEQHDMELPSAPSVEQKVDEGVKETFPASDPVSVSKQNPVKTTQPPAQPRRSPDWLLDKHQH
jgi:hypothetical protein